MPEASLTFSFAIALAAGIVAQSLARQIRVPGIVLLLAAGVALGPDGFGWVDPGALGAGLFSLIDVGVAVILFEGGLNLEVSRLRRQEGPIRGLITVGALVTLIGATLAVRFLLDWPWNLAVLFGSLVVVTGPTVVTPLVRELRLRPELRTIIEAEGVLIDPIGAILAVVVLQIVLFPVAGTVVNEFLGLIGRLGFGLLAGGVGGLALGGLLRVRGLVPLGLENIFSLAAVVLLFAGADRMLSHSGILAVTVAGVVVGNLGTPVDRDLREFKDQLTVMLVGLIFVLLAAGIHLDDVRALGVPGALVIAALVAVVRPLGVWLSTRGSGLSTREKVMIAWMGPRGIVAAAIATLTAEALIADHMPGGPALRALVFLTICATVLLVGMTALPLAALLKLRLPGRDRVAILGAQGLGLALGRELKQAGTPIIFLDLSNDKPPAHIEQHAGEVLFDGPHDLERWDVRWRHGYASVQTFVRGPAGEQDAVAHVDRAAAAKGDLYVIMAIRRGRRTQPMTYGLEPRDHDVAVVALYDPERAEALPQLAALGWVPGEPPAVAEEPPPAPLPASHGWT